jgi:hypothetical protein
MISLSLNGTAIALDEDLLWSDEFAWTPVAQSVTRSISGALIIQVAGDAASPGRPITLQPEDDRSAWTSRADLEVIKAWAAIPGAVLQLTLRDVTRDVMFRHQDKPAIEARPVVHFSDVEPGDSQLVTFKFMEV